MHKGFQTGHDGGYVRFRKWIEGAFTSFFAGAAIYLVTAREQQQNWLWTSRFIGQYKPKTPLMRLAFENRPI